MESRLNVCLVCRRYTLPIQNQYAYRMITRSRVHNYITKAFSCSLINVPIWPLGILQICILQILR